jgi:hypothetical protein
MSEPDVSETIFPWGKHKGNAFNEIPESYLRWVLTLEDLRPWLKKAIDEYLSITPIQRAINKEKNK